MISHALNQVASARRFAQESETFYENVNVIVCHLGGGISVGAHCQGRYVDANNALDGEGPFTPERSGTPAAGQLADLCFSGRYTHAEIKRMIKGAGGLIALLGTSDLREVERRIAAGDAVGGRGLRRAGLPGREVGGRAAAGVRGREARPHHPHRRHGPVDSRSCERLRHYLSGLPCGITVYPGENEMVALAKGALRVLYEKEEPREYLAEEAGAAVTEPFPYEAAVDERFVRASGPGGQNVNKVATAVELRFDVERAALPAGVKARLLELAGSRIAADGRVLIDSREHRTQVAEPGGRARAADGPDPPGQPDPARAARRRGPRPPRGKPASRPRRSGAR